MAGYRLIVIAALAYFSLPIGTRFVAAQEPNISATTLSATLDLTTTTPVISTTTISPSPTSSSPSPTSTSSSSSSSSSPSPTSISSSSPSPTTTPTPPANSYFLYNKTSHRVCVLVMGDIQLTLSYTNASDNKTTVTRDLPVTGDLNATVDDMSSFCTENNTVLTLSFHNDTDYNHTLTFHFNTTKDGYELTSITTQLYLNDATVFPGYNSSLYDNVTGTTKVSIFNVGGQRSYKCDSSRSYDMNRAPSGALQNLEVKLSSFQAQAFSFKNDDDQFDKSITCTRDQKTSKIVPIAVGAALAGLVVVVLVAYLIGRFRSRKQNSYEALS